MLRSNRFYGFKNKVGSGGKGKVGGGKKKGRE